MKNRSLLNVTVSIVVGLVVASAMATPTCPPTLTSCPNGNYGKYGSQVWLCCTDSSHVDCHNYFKQKYVCNYEDPGEPATYGYDIIDTHDRVNLNCDNTGSCY